MNILNYIYYQMYRILSTSSRYNAEFGAALYLGGLLSLNILAILWVANKKNVIHLPDLPMYYWGGLGLALSLFFVFIYKGKRSDKIIKKYELESRKQKILGGFLVGIYVILSFVMLFIVGFYKIR